MISTDEALGRVLALMRPVERTEEAPLTEAAGRALARPVAATRTQPPFPASAMDGYAVRGAELRPGAVFRVIGEAQAGRRFPGGVGPGEAVRIFTGAPVPEGADRVLIQEDAAREGDRITARDRLDAGPYVRPAGLDFREGEEMSPRRLSPQDVALLAAMGHPSVPVRARPDIALIPTGDELEEPGTPLGPDQIVSSNGYGLHALLAEAGAAPRLLPIARDTRDSLRAALEEARGADLIVTLGGASVGDRDLVREVFGAEGLALDFYKVAMRPGKPLMAGRIGPTGTPMLGLPGNPVSAMVCGHLFLRPAAAALSGLPAGPVPRGRLPLAAPIPANGPREHFARARRVAGEDGPALEVSDRQDSSILSALAWADCLAVIPPNSPALEAGAQVDFVALRDVPPAMTG